MSLNIWRGLSVFLLIVVLLQFYLIISERGGVPEIQGLPTRPPPVSKVSGSDTGAWKFNTERDSENHALSYDQCSDAFPNLYYEIDRAVSLWQKKDHTINADDIDISWRNDGAIRLMIHDNHLRIIEQKGAWFKNSYRIRTLYVLLQIYRALLGASAAGEPVPNIEFSIVVDDMSLIPGKEDDTHSVWAFTRKLDDKKEERLWIVPDHNFFASPPIASSWHDGQRKAKNFDAFVVDKIPQAVWRGARWTNPFARGHLLDLTVDKEWADVKEVIWKNKTNVMRLEDFCRYMFVVHTEGRSWSGRLKYLLNCDSVPIVHELDWTAQFYHLLKADGPDKNYIKVKKDFSDLEKKVNYYLEHPKEAQDLADNAVKTFRSRYTSPAAESCYWRRIMHSWSNVAFKPEPFETGTVNISGIVEEEQQLRGTAFEEFMYMKNEEFT